MQKHLPFEACSKRSLEKMLLASIIFFATMVAVNKTTIFFIALVILGLAIAVYFSPKSDTKESKISESTLLGSSPTPNVQLPSGINTLTATPAPTLTPITAETALIKTVKGDIKIKFYPQDAPKTVSNFVTLAANKYYDGLTFHRVEPGFVVQGGDPNGNGTGGYSIYGKTFEDELNPNTESYREGYTEGTVAMANRGPNTNGSQFFIMWSDKTDLPRNYTIFGKVTEGMDVVHKMVAGDKIISITVE